MKARMLVTHVALPVLAIAAAGAQARAADFDWMKFKGKTVTFLANNNPVSQALLTYKADFEKLTGMTLKVDGYQEQQMRQRLVTVMNASSDEVDVFMTLPSREGEQFAAAGWYGDLTAMAKNDVATEYDPAGLSQALLKAATFGGKLTSMPMNIEGPIFYYRTDIFKKCTRHRGAENHQGRRGRGREDQDLRQRGHAVRLARPQACDRLHFQQCAAQCRRQLHRGRQVEPLLGQGQGGTRHL
ncbi:ABC-type glycerol-3-phosphate transport system substrate-binding protein [Bradyrhizobium sp. LB7.1]